MFLYVCVCVCVCARKGPGVGAVCYTHLTFSLSIGVTFHSVGSENWRLFPLVTITFSQNQERSSRTNMLKKSDGTTRLWDPTLEPTLQISQATRTKSPISCGCEAPRWQTEAELKSPLQHLSRRGDPRLPHGHIKNLFVFQGPHGIANGPHITYIPI